MEARRAHNPEVVGSSPASATIKTPVFTTKSGVFLTFMAVLETVLLPFWVIFGSISPPNAFEIAAEHGMEMLTNAGRNA